MELRGVNLSGVNITTIPAPITPIVTSGLQVQLRPDSYSGSGNTWEDTQNNADATLTGSPSYNSTTGFSFDGLTQYGILPSIAGVTDFDNTGSYTIEIWFNASLGQEELSSTMIKKWEYASGRAGIYPYSMDYSEATVSVSNYAAYTGQGNTNAISANVNVNTWYQNVCVWNYTGSEIGGNNADANTAWLNSVKQTVSQGNLSTFPSPSNNYDVGIARTLGLPPTGQLPGWFKGQIGIIRIYNRALTSSEILQNFNADKSIFGL